MYTWVDVLVHQERRRDLVREAEQDRLMQRALAGHSGRARFYCQALTWLGGRLAAWGLHLQERYSVTAPVRGQVFHRQLG